MSKKTETSQTVAIREKYSCYKVADIAVKLYLNDIPTEDIAYILQGGEEIKMQPYSKLQAYLAQVMDRMEQRISRDIAIGIRQDSACCLVGKRDNLAKQIYKNNADIDSRWQALCKERYIIGGKGWKENDDYYITYWYAKPENGYTCGCLRCIPEKSMNMLWCECCAGHIKHHFETALGVKAKCTCKKSALNSCGQEACLFKLNIIEEVK